MKRRGIGKMRRRLQACEPVDAPDAIGGAQRSFAARFAIWADIEALRAQPDFVAGREEVSRTHRIRMRAGRPVAAGWRLGFSTRRFDVLSAEIDDAARGYVICQAREVV